MLGVVQGLLGLIEIEILGRAALGDQDDVRRLGELLPVQGVEKGAARPMGFRHVSRDGFQNLLMLGKDHVQNEVDAYHGPGFLDVQPEGIPFQVSGAAFRQDHAAVVGLDGGPGGHAGHDGFSAAGIAGKIVIFDVAQADAPIRLRHDPGDVHGGAPGGRAIGDAVIGVAVHALDLGIGTLSGQLPPFRLRMLPMAAQGEHQGDVLRSDAARIELVQQGGHDLGRGHGPGDVAGDDGYGLPGADRVPKPGGADGLLQGAGYLRLAGEAQGHVVGVELPYEIPLGDLHLLNTCAKSKCQLHFALFLATMALTCSSMWAAVRPNRFCRYPWVPTSPNSSSTATQAAGTGQPSARASSTAV